MKYGTQLVEGNEDSRIYILDWVEPGTTVLEFGCAYGQMTQYMKEQKNCKVYIVEYVPEMYEHAIPFAQDGVCDDIMRNAWLEKFSGVRFDYILFTDVLEHLPDPSAVLKNAVSLLKEEGSVLLSVPNVAHYDIVGKLLQGRFDYTAEGLLDETHIHFFTAATLLEMLGSAGLKPSEWKYTFAGLRETEQERCGGGVANIPAGIYNYMEERGEGAVYQYMVKAGLNVAEAADYVWPTREIRGQVYYDCGDGYREQNRLFFHSGMAEPGYYEADVALKLPDGVKNLRLDPLEGQSCRLIYLRVDAVGEQTEEAVYYLQEPVFLPGADPQINIPGIAGGVKEIRIRIKYEAESVECCLRLIEQLQQNNAALKQEVEVQKQEVEVQKQETEAQKQEVRRLVEYSFDLKVRISDLESEKIAAGEKIAELCKERDFCRAEAERCVEGKEQLEAELERVQQELYLIKNSRIYGIMKKIKRGLLRK